MKDGRGIKTLRGTDRSVCATKGKDWEAKAEGLSVKDSMQNANWEEPAGHRLEGLRHEEDDNLRRQAAALQKRKQACALQIRTEKTIGAIRFAIAPYVAQASSLVPQGASLERRFHS